MTFMSSIIRRMEVSWTSCEVLQASKDRRAWTDIIANVEQHGTKIDRYRPCTCRLLVDLCCHHFIAHGNGDNKKQPRDAASKACWLIKSQEGCIRCSTVVYMF